MPHLPTSNYDARLLRRLDEVLVARYGRDGDILDRGYRLDLQEAGYATVGVSSALQSALDGAGTSFQTVAIETRLDLLFQDLLSHPRDVADGEWAERYGYSSVSAAYRAFRERFGIPVGEVRRMGSLGLWLAHNEHAPNGESARARDQEARRRIESFARSLDGKRVGPRTRTALEALGRSVYGSVLRPRYPAISQTEGRRLRRET